MTRICVPISNRTNYSKLKPILIKLKSVRELILDIVPSSSIVIDRVGDSLKDIESDGFSIQTKIECLLMNDSFESMVKTSGLSMIDHATLYSNSRPDALLVVGDRFDILPPVWAARIMNIPILHIQGGERSGCIDDIVRDIVSICSERHYVATDLSYEHVLNIAHNKSVFNFGCPAVELIQNMPVGDFLNCSNFSKKYKKGFDIKPNEPYMLVVVHPDTTANSDIDMSHILESVLSFQMKSIVIYPNIDAHYGSILAAIREFSSKIICVKHLPLADFVKLMAHASCFVGNSSSGIRETASFGTPTVNIGTRQQFRERNINTIDCGITKSEITVAIQKSLDHGRYLKNNVYYKQDCANNICKNICSYFNI